MSTAATRLLHLHMPKAAGTALRIALRDAMGPATRLCPAQLEREAASIDPAAWDLISGHFGYDTLSGFGGRIVTVLRDPVDRFVSVYYFWRQLHARGGERSRKTDLATRFSLEDFATFRDEIALIEQFQNSMTWQLAAANPVPRRHALRDAGMTDGALLTRAMDNLRACAVVGLQDRMDDFAASCAKRLGLDLALQRRNVTMSRAAVEEISTQARRRIMDWVYLDVELYQAACALVAKG